MKIDLSHFYGYFESDNNNTRLGFEKTGLSFAETSSANQSEVDPNKAEQDHSIADVNQPSNPVFVSGLEALPASLFGTEVDGQIRTDTEGNLIISRDIRLVFDYFLSALGEEDHSRIEARILAYLNHSLPSDAAKTASNLFKSYLGLLQERKSLEEYAIPSDALEIDLDAIRHQKEQLHAINSKYLDDETITAFFGQEEALDSYMLARIPILKDTSLSQQEKAQQLRILEESLPDNIRKERTKRQGVIDLHQLSKTRTGDLSEHDLQKVREQTVGKEATRRLEKLDQERRIWKKRIASWLSIRQNLKVNKWIDANTLEKEIIVLREKYFSADELNRVKALERVEDSG